MNTNLEVNTNNTNMLPATSQMEEKQQDSKTTTVASSTFQSQKQTEIATQADLFCITPFTPDGKPNAVKDRIEAYVKNSVAAADKCQNMSLDDTRKTLSKFYSERDEDLEPVGKIVDLKADGVPVRIYYPLQGKAPYSAIVYYHAGGWVFGAIPDADGLCRMLCNQTGHVIISTEYRRSPENHFPAPFDDCYTVLQWTQNQAKTLGINPERIGVGGPSAGGCLSTCMALKERDTKKKSQIAFELILCPCLNYPLDKKVYDDCADQRYLSYGAMNFFWSCYLKDPKDGENPYASPPKAQSLANMPPSFVLVAENDPLRLEAEQYAERLKKAGNTVILKKFAGVPHNFIQFPKRMKLPQQEEALKDIATFVNSQELFQKK